MEHWMRAIPADHRPARSVFALLLSLVDALEGYARLS
jgi:hypothetical protein